MKKSKKRPLHEFGRKRIWIWLFPLLLAGALLFARCRWGAQLEPRLLVLRLRELGTVGGAVPAFFGLYLAGTSLLLPAVGFAIVAAVVWGYGPGVLLALLAFNLSSNAQFWVGRRLGQARIEAWLVKRGWSAAVMRGTRMTTVIAVRQLPLPFVAVNLAAGASPMKWWHFALGSGVGGLPPTLVYTWFATALIDGVEGARTEALLKALAGGAMVVALALTPRLWSWWSRRSNRLRGGA